MLYTLVVTLCLVCFLHCFEPVQCRSTGHLNEYSNRSSLTRRCLQSCFLISRHQTCFEKCLGKNKEGDFTYLNARIQRINPPHLTPTFKRRKRSTEGCSLYGIVQLASLWVVASMKYDHITPLLRSFIGCPLNIVLPLIWFYFFAFRGRKWYTLSKRDKRQQLLSNFENPRT